MVLKKSAGVSKYLLYKKRILLRACKYSKYKNAYHIVKLTYTFHTVPIILDYIKRFLPKLFLNITCLLKSSIHVIHWLNSYNLY